MSSALRCPNCLRVLMRATHCPTCACALEAVPQEKINNVVSIETKAEEKDEYPYGPAYAESTIEYIQRSVTNLEAQITALRKWIDNCITRANNPTEEEIEQMSGAGKHE